MDPGLQISHVKTVLCVDIQITVDDKILRIREAGSSGVDGANRYLLEIYGYGTGLYGRYRKLRKKISHLGVNGQCIEGPESSRGRSDAAGADLLLAQGVEFVGAVEKRALF